jgi:thiamine kinase-like enzyme
LTTLREVVAFKSVALRRVHGNGMSLGENNAMTEPLLIQILERLYQGGPVRCSLVAQGEKDVFHVRRSLAPDWIARMYRVTAPAPSRDRVLTLANLLVYLEHHQYPAERVVRTVSSALTTQSEQWHILVTTYLGSSLQAWQPASTDGAAPTPTPAARMNNDPQLLFHIGALLGQLHALDATGPTAELMIGPGLQAAAELAWASDQLAQLQPRVPTHLQDEYAHLTTRIQQVRRFDACPQTIIHGDCHFGNVVGTPTHSYSFVDWEAAGRGAAVTDLGLLLSSSLDPSDNTPNRAIIRSIIDGYCVHRTLSRIESELLADAMRFRILVTLAGAYEQRCSSNYQPAQRFWGSTYNEWEQQELRATQIARIAQERLEELATTDEC